MSLDFRLIVIKIILKKKKFVHISKINLKIKILGLSNVESKLEISYFKNIKIRKLYLVENII